MNVYNWVTLDICIHLWNLCRILHLQSYPCLSLPSPLHFCVAKTLDPRFIFLTGRGRAYKCPGSLGAGGYLPLSAGSRGEGHGGGRGSRRYLRLRPLSHFLLRCLLVFLWLRSVKGRRVFQHFPAAERFRAHLLQVNPCLGLAASTTGPCRWTHAAMSWCRVHSDGERGAAGPKTRRPSDLGPEDEGTGLLAIGAGHPGPGPPLSRASPCDGAPGPGSSCGVLTFAAAPPSWKRPVQRRWGRQRERGATTSDTPGQERCCQGRCPNGSGPCGRTWPRPQCRWATEGSGRGAPGSPEQPLEAGSPEAVTTVT